MTGICFKVIQWEGGGVVKELMKRVAKSQRLL